MQKPLIFGAAALVILSGAAMLPASAGPVAAEQEPVHVSGMRNPELKTYRVMAAGLDAFDDHHDLAPTAKLVRFKLTRRAGMPQLDMDNLALRISGDTISIPVPVAADGTFVLPRSEAADDEDADLILNKKKGGYRWRADVRSEGVPANMRRLGDLRLECQVMVATAKKEMGFWIRSLINSFLLTTDWCNVDKLQLATKTDRKIRSATLLHQGERIRLHLSDDDTAYVPPLADKTYPNDTLIEIEYDE
ncbi:MAG TPA: hypothetical protein VFT37_02330 [Telluria sp.]|nr:hypothetical protein [Telluria sp.]